MAICKVYSIPIFKATALINGADMRLKIRIEPKK